jgi:hypothetical protein
LILAGEGLVHKMAGGAHLVLRLPRAGREPGAEAAGLRSAGQRAAGQRPRAVPTGNAVGRGRMVVRWPGGDVMGQAKMRELKRAARQLGVTSTTLRRHGWKTASPARVKAAAVDARWAPEVSRARQEARQLAGELAPGQVRARIGRERDASYQAARYRAGQLLQRVPGGDDGQVRDP